MIQLIPDLIPFLLLHLDTNSSVVRCLLDKANHCRTMGDLQEAERCAQNVRQSCQEGYQHVECAAALICLSDIYRESGKPGRALHHAEEALDIFRRQVGQAQRHNEAVAAYNLGLLHHILGNEPDAFTWYQKALHLLEPVCNYWARLNQSERKRTCIQLEHWVQALSSCLERSGSRDGRNGVVIFPAPAQNGDGGSFSVARWEVQGYLLGRLTIDGQKFEVWPIRSDGVIILADQAPFKAPPGGLPGLRLPPVVPAEDHYRALKVPEQAPLLAGAQAGDLVLVHQTQQKYLNVPYYAVEHESELFFGHFERDLNGAVRFVGLDDKVILGDVGEQDPPPYCPVAILRPEDT